MIITLTAMLIVSWLLLFFMLFLYERLDQRLAVVHVLLDRLRRSQESMQEHLGVEVPDDDVTVQLRDLVQEGKTYEAIVAYRSIRGTTYKEAKAFVDAIRHD